MRNSEGVVLWTHDIGSGLVAPKADRLVERGAPANAGKGKGVRRDDSGSDTGTDIGNRAGDGVEDGEDVEVRSVPPRPNRATFGRTRPIRAGSFLYCC